MYPIQYCIVTANHDPKAGTVSTDAAPEAPITARRAQTRQRLMTAARGAFAEHSVEAASVEEICEAAGFTRGAFYSNFSDRSDLVLAMIQQSIQTQFAAAERAIATMKEAGDLDPEELVSIALSALTGAGAALGTASQDVITDRAMMLYAARDPELRGPYLDFVDTCTAQIATLIADALRHARLELTAAGRRRGPAAGRHSQPPADARALRRAPSRPCTARHAAGQHHPAGVAGR